MKLLLFSFCFSVLAYNSFSQDKKDITIIDECNISMNRTLMKDVNNENRNGFGIGIYKSFRSQKPLNIKIGFEYNRIRFFEHNKFEGHLQSSTNVNYAVNSLSMPLGIRFNIGKETKFFVETGGYADLILSTKTKGTRHNILPGTTYIGYEETSFNESTKLTNSIGVYFGIGARIPVSKFELIIKPEYKFALKASESDYDEIYFRYIKIAIGLKLRNN
jgi:hypothetical protein